MIYYNILLCIMIYYYLLLFIIIYYYILLYIIMCIGPKFSFDGWQRKLLRMNNVNFDSELPIRTILETYIGIQKFN